MLTYRLFDFSSDDTGELFSLFARIYGNSADYEKRWRWEYEQHPQKQDFKIFVAEKDGRIVGATTRLPVNLQAGREKTEAAFNCNSMVHPDYRRMGIMERLYTESAVFIPTLLSKGTLPGMYRLLKKMGYRDIVPNTFMTAMILPLHWMLWRFGVYKQAPNFIEISSPQKSGFRKIDRYGSDFDNFYQKVFKQYDILICKDANYMNWRYIDCPFKKYLCVQRTSHGGIVSSFVLAAFGSHAKIVDFLWDNEAEDEPEASIRYAKNYAAQCGFLKLICWTTDEKLRSALKKKGFWQRKESPRFSAYSGQADISALLGGRRGFFEGDGDSEYL